MFKKAMMTLNWHYCGSRHLPRASSPNKFSVRTVHVRKHGLCCRPVYVRLSRWWIV